MSHSLYYSSVSPLPCMPRPTRPNYTLRRVAVAGGLIVGLVLVSVVLVLLAGLGGRPASASRAAPAHTNAAVHVATAGDSLWSIAETNRGDVSVDRYVDALITLNGGTEVQIGQAVRLP